MCERERETARERERERDTHTERERERERERDTERGGERERERERHRENHIHIFTPITRIVAAKFKSRLSDSPRDFFRLLGPPEGPRSPSLFFKTFGV